MVTTGGTKPPKARSKRDADDGDPKVVAAWKLQAMVCDIGMMIESNPNMQTTGKTRVILSMRRRRQTWRS